MSYVALYCIRYRRFRYDIVYDIVYDMGFETSHTMSYIICDVKVRYRIRYASACRITDKDWLLNRRLDLYHRSMDHVIADLNDLCLRDIYLRYADNRIRLSRAFYHVLVLEGAEVAAATMCDTTQCPVCKCPHKDLDRTEVSYPY